VRRGPLSVHTRLTLWYAGALLAILVVISVLSYSLLAWSLAQDVDRSLLALAGVVRDAPRGDAFDEAEWWLRDLLDPEHQLVQLLGPDGRLRMRSWRLRDDVLPLPPEARRSVAAGRAVFETVTLHGQRIRTVALPVQRDGRLVEVVQVGVPLAPTERTLHRWIEALLVLVPLGVGLAIILVFVINRRSFGWTLDLVLSASQVGEAMVLSIGAALLAGLYPSWKMSRANPAHALREE